MKQPSLQTKRNPVKRPAYRALHANTKRTKSQPRSRKLRATTAAVSASHVVAEEPSINMGRSLIMILALHVVAIIGIIVHMKYFSEGTVISGASPVVADAKPSGTFERHMIEQGETFASIARAYGVDESALRAINTDKIPKVGVMVRIPAPTPAPVVPEPVSQPVETTQVIAQVEPIDAKPAVLEQPQETISTKPVSYEKEVTAAKVEKKEKVISAPRAMIVEEVQPQASAPARAIPVAEVAPTVIPVDSGVRYTVVRGDTLWRISQKFKVPSDQIMALNGMDNANMVRIGQSLKIPAQQ